MIGASGVPVVLVRKLEPLEPEQQGPSAPGSNVPSAPPTPAGNEARAGAMRAGYRAGSRGAKGAGCEGGGMTP